jgi:hypothetical protein
MPIAIRITMASKRISRDFYVSGSRIIRKSKTADTSRYPGQSAKSPQEDTTMKEPGIDNRHRDKNPPMAGDIQQRRGGTLNKNFPKPIAQFSPNAKFKTMREETGKVSVESVWRAARKLRADVG